MRRLPNNRGVPPKLLTTTRHLFLFDQSANTDDARDLCGFGGNLLDLDAVGTPEPCAAWGAAGGRLLNGTSEYFEKEDPSHADHARMTGSLLNTEVEITFRVGANFTTAGSLVCYGDDYDSDETVLEIHIDADRHPCAEWNSSGSHIVTTFDTVTLRAGSRHQIAMRLDWDTGDLTLWLDGALIEGKDVSGTLPDVAAGTMYWRAGAIKGGSTATRFFNGELYAIRIDSSDTRLTIDDFREDFRRAMLLSGCSTGDAIVELEDASAIPGVYQDMSTFLGCNWIESVEWSDDADANMEQAKIGLFRSKQQATLAKYFENRANMPADYPPAIGPTDTYSTDGSEDILRTRQGARIKAARVPYGITPTADDYIYVFKGKVAQIDWAGDIVQANCNDLADDMNRATIEHTTHFPTNDVDHSLEDTIRDYSGGTHGVLDKTFAEGWSEGTIPDLVVPVATDTTITHWIQDRQLVYPLCVGMAEQLAFLLRYRWWDATDDFELMLYEPERTRSYEDAYFTSDDYTAVPTFRVDADDERTRVRIVFQSTAPGDPPSGTCSYGGWTDGTITADSEGGPLQYYVEVSGEDIDATFDETGKRQFCEIAEGSSGQCRTYEQAYRWACGIVRDLYKATDFMAVDFRGIFEIECEDTLYMAADGIRSTVDFRMAVYSKSHRFQGGKFTTSVTMRGKPSGGVKRWLSREVSTLGIMSGVMVKDDIATSAPSRAERTSRWGVIERSGIIRTADAASICNKQFVQASYGPTYPFDGWEAVAGEWGTDFDADTAEAIRGAYCLRVKTALP